MNHVGAQQPCATFLESCGTCPQESPQTSTCVHRLSPLNPQGCSPSAPQAVYSKIERMTDEHTYPDLYEPGPNVTVFMLPASWEDMEFLGLDPLTGEPAGDRA